MDRSRQRRRDQREDMTKRGKVRERRIGRKVT